MIALRSAGFNNVDLKAAERLGLTVVRVPAYSPYAVAELGFDLHGKTAGVAGTGKIGAIVARILVSLGCKILAHDFEVGRAQNEVIAKQLVAG